MRNRIHGAFGAITAGDKLKNSTMAYLEEQVYRQKQKRSPLRRFCSAAAPLIAVIVAVVYSMNLYFTESGFVDIDVNPGIELSVNSFGCVIGVRAYNEDGARVLENVDLRHISCEGALAVLIAKMTELGYVTDTGLLTVTLQSTGGKDTSGEVDAISAWIDSALKSQGSAVRRNVFAVDPATKAHANEENLTPAKYLAILELQKYDPAATFDSCRDHSISDIEKEIHEHTDDDGSDHGGGGGGEHGHGKEDDGHGHD